MPSFNTAVSYGPIPIGLGIGHCRGSKFATLSSSMIESFSNAGRALMETKARLDSNRQNVKAAASSMPWIPLKLSFPSRFAERRKKSPVRVRKVQRLEA